MRTLLARSAVLAATAAVLAGCGLGGGTSGGEVGATGEVKGEVSLQTWALKPKFTDYVQGVIDAFQKKYPGTTVKWLDQPGDGYADKVLSQAASGELPDVVNLPPDMALPLAKQDMLLDIAANDDKLRADYVPGGVSAYEFAGRQGAYAYPWYLNTDVNYWNADLLTRNGLDPKKLPASVDDLIAQARVMKERSGGQMYLMSRKPELGDLANAGVKLLSDDGSRFTFNTPEAAAVLDKYRAAFAEGLMPRDVLTDKYLGNSELFKKQQVAWTTGGGNTINSIKVDNPTLATKIVPSAAFGTPPLYVQGLSVSRKSKNLPAALALARFVTSPENQAAFAKLVPGIFPSTTASASDPAFSQSDGTNAGDAKVLAFQALGGAKLLQPPVVSEAMGDYIKQQISLAVNGEISSKEALDRAVAKCDELLKS
ncbi:extracellular solute-binding protein [Saccharothrix mutabilis subsp. mutabilis]|uniref:Extracellular solute-binding protein n=1 Tax=Saccharothrix mutabilis subsp. mutabilis TaxID=66855 RepID=A0ABN0T0E9_9PSEU